MRVTHEMEFSRKCPVNNGWDHYQLRIETDGLLKVEDILGAVEGLPEKAFQEDITEQLAAQLQNCRVTTTGYHSGVKTTCTV